LALYYLQETRTIVKERSKTCAVLSPSLYWYAHAEFPTRSLKKARKLADNYLASRPASYTAIYVEREGDGFACYAYDASNLTLKLEENGLPRDTPCYFLQQFADYMPLRIDEDLIAKKVAGVCIEIEDSSRTLPMLDALDLENLASPFNRSKGEMGVRKPLMVALLALLALTATLDLGLRYQSLSSAESALEKLRSGRSVYEIKVLLSRYETLHAQQTALRDAIRQSLKPPLKTLRCTPQEGCRRESR
jgi:hypothetical protein